MISDVGNGSRDINVYRRDINVSLHKRPILFLNMAERSSTFTWGKSGFPSLKINPNIIASEFLGQELMCPLQREEEEVSICVQVGH